jgi:segregation and condensation protein A
VAKVLIETKNKTVEDELVLEQDTEHKQSPTLTPVAADGSVVEPAGEPVLASQLAEQSPADSDHKPRLDELRNVGSQQGEMPFAIVQGQALTEIPQDLYIPPDALEVFLEAFEGPLDLLLYLIKRQNIDILEINVARITAQYMQYVNMMSAVQFELAAEYLLMAAMLAEIKSRMLLPRSSEVEDDEEDPRAQLIRRLQEYERFKQAAEDMDELPRLGRDLQLVSVDPPDIKRDRPEPEVEMKELLLALGEVLRRADMFESHHVTREKLSTRERMSQVLSTLTTDQFTPFVSLFTVDEGRLGVIVTFLAIMELIKESLIEMVQTEAFGPIHVKARAS